jgi:hypothetical protein
MSTVKLLFVVAALTIASSFARGAVTPRWVRNPIAPHVLALPPFPDDAQSWSLVVDLSGSSLFSEAKLQATLPPAGAYYNHAGGTNFRYFSLLGMTLFPDLAFDTYVATTTSGRSIGSDPDNPDPVLAGGAFDAGPAIVGSGQQFDATWVATPNTGPAGGTGLEIARLTWSGGGVPIISDGVLNPDGPNPNRISKVFSSDDPNNGVPIPQIPEPASLAMLALVGGFMLGRTGAGVRGRIV